MSESDRQDLQDRRTFLMSLGGLGLGGRWLADHAGPDALASAPGARADPGGGLRQSVKESGFEGFVAQEFIPTRDPVTSLAEAYRTCRV